MVAKISYFIIFGIITVITGSPARDDTDDSHYVRNEYELQKLLQSLNNQGKYDVQSNHREVGLNARHKNRAGSSRYDKKPRLSYYHNDKAESPQYYESREEQPSIDTLQIINRFLENNDNKPRHSNVQNLLEDLLSLNRNNKFKLLKPNDETDNVDEVVSYLGDLQQKVADDVNYGNDRGPNNNLKSKLFLGDNYDQEVADQDKPDLFQARNGLMKLFENIVGSRPRYNKQDYSNLGYDIYNQNNRNNRDARDDGSYNDRDDLHCRGKNCARTNKVINDDRNNGLRCRGRNCARNRFDDIDDNDSALKYDAKFSTQKIKVNDELDAVVLGLSDVERMLTKLNAPKQQRTNKVRGTKLHENVEFENLLNSRSSVNKNANVEAIIFDLTQVENGDAVARQIKRLLSQNNEGSYDEYEEYGNLVKDHLKQGIYDLQTPVGKGTAKSKILPHKEDNNNVYLPQWLLDEVIARSYGEKAPAREHSKSLFPLTQQQKEKLNKVHAAKNQNSPRIFRRNFEQDVGVPFHLEVQGLGQVNP